MKKNALNTLKLKKTVITKLTPQQARRIEGGSFVCPNSDPCTILPPDHSATCCNYSCSCDTINPDLTADC